MQTSGYDARVFSEWSSRPADQRFESLEAITAAIMSRTETAHERTLPLAKLNFYPDSSGALVMEPDSSNPVALNHWAFGQVASRFSAPAEFLRRLPVDTTASVLNTLVSRAARDPSDPGAKLLLHEGDSFDTARAITSPTYGRIWDRDLVRLMTRMVDMSGGALFNPREWGGKPGGLYASDSDCFLFFIDGGSLVDGGGERDQLFRGAYGWNSEVGKCILGLRTFMFQQVCGNFQIWGQREVREVRIRHTGRAPERFASEAWGAVKGFLDSSTAGEVAAIKAAKARELPTDSKLRLEHVMGLGFTASEARNGISAAETEIGSCQNYWQLVDGLTMHARSYATIDRKTDLETRAGRLMRLDS